MDMGTCIGRLALSHEFSDVHIVVGEGEEVFPAHKLILAARCEYFRKMFYNTQMKEAQDGICKFLYDDPIVIKTLIYHLYERPLEEPLEADHVVMCLVTAEKYGIDTFKSYCLQVLERMISIANACYILGMLEELYEDRLDVPDIVKKYYQYHRQKFFRLLTLRGTLLIRYVLTNITSIIEAEEHLGLSENVFRRILKHPALPCKEIDLYKAVLSWHKHHHGDFQTNREILMTHLSMLDLRLIDLKDIATFVHNSGVFSPFELSELYRLRISLQQSGTTRTNRKFALVFHSGQEYSSRTGDVVQSLAAVGINICDEDIIYFTEKSSFSSEQLMQYSAVLVFSMETRNKGSCGDALADYVDQGGCLILCQAIGCIEGRITTEKYLPLRRMEPTTGEFQNYHLGKIYSPSHFLFEKVSNVKVRCGPNFVWNCSPTEGSTILAEWNDGTILACEKTCGKGRVLMLNLYPVSTRVVVVGIDRDCDGSIFKTCCFEMHYYTRPTIRVDGDLTELYL